MLEEILPGLYRAEIPLPNNPLKWLNAYIVKGKDRFLIIDTGFNRKECLDAMTVSLQRIGVDLTRTDFFITHLHVDHMGLVGRLATGASRIYFNELEARRVASLQSDPQQHWEEVLKIYIANGFEADVARTSLMRHPAHKYGPEGNIDFTMVRDGDFIKVGDYRFKCIATPGHSPGHMSLYEAQKRILVAGDHILFDITPNITHWAEMTDPLESYLKSLAKVAGLDVALVLPGHRRLVHDLKGRIKELEAHHRARLDEVMRALRDGEKNIREIAPYISWDITARTWDDFPPAQKWFAFGETFAHVIYLERQGRVKRKNKEGKITYTLA